MSKLEELLKEYCPNGVEYKSIETICSFRRGSFPQPYTNQSWYGGKGSMPFVQVADMQDCSFNLVEETKQTISRLAQPKSVFIKKGTILVSIQGTIGRVSITQYDSYVDRTIAIFYGYDEKVINKKFLAYALKQKFDIEKQYARGSTLKTITKEEFAKFQIPLPALAVQSEIVHILDSFTLYSQELTAELTARRKQYEYYRDKLLIPKEIKIDWKCLKDICNLVTGATPTTSKKEYWENGTIPWMSSGEVNKKVIFDTDGKITELGYSSASTTMVPKHSVVIALAGQGKTRGKVAITEIELCTNQSLCSMICGDSINYKYLYYYLDSKYEELRTISNGDGARGGLSLRLLNPYQVPVPPIEVQDEIVRELDKMTALIERLESELSEREKQFSYYRDKLLTFKEKAE